jgi:hypothetical protein
MRPKAVVAIPAKCSPSVRNHIAKGLREKYSFIDFDFEEDATIERPEGKSLERLGADLGMFNGDPDKPMEALLDGIFREANDLFRSALEAEARA